MFKPMKAQHVKDLNKLRFPLLASTKLDGIRAMVQNGVLVSRNLTPIQNRHVRSLFSIPALEGLDGELIMGRRTEPDVFRKTSSAVMSYGGEPEVTFWVFDKYDCTSGFTQRLREAKTAVSRTYRDLPCYNDNGIAISCLKILQHIQINDLSHLQGYEEEMVTRGFEGVMLRDPEGPYKQGRSTEREGWLLKLKRFEDSEAEVIGFEEKMHNGNEATRQLSGKLKRSSAKAGLVPLGTLGALLARDLKTGCEFNVGGGFDDALRNEIWQNRPAFLGKIFTYKFFPVGVKDKPRHPNFKGWRDKADLD